MKFTAAFVLALAGSALAKNKTGSTSTKSQCKQIAKLTALVDLASNTTALEAKAKNNATKVENIQAKASDAVASLATLTTNSTLMDACAQIASVEAMDDACSSMAKFESLIALAANTTALDDKTKNNATKAASIVAKASSAATKLDALASNTTLTQYCAVQSSLSDCKSIEKLQKTIASASNTTALEAKFGSDTKKIASVQSKATKASTELAALSSNSTLLDICSSAGINVAAAAAAAASSTSSSTATASKTSGAMRTDAWSMGALSALFAAALSVYMI
ncbi:hypothetical protein F503_03279 [Ophiostoma piceae UAMH 11346]|uniref:Cell wall protein n=1 Tax=Ophiostoma piceae (strain UAMH 11346) TaxID=1262450 RepID=S3C271_OPHP1|nr:hypothetical protein F503_03279 [Ophiostoma piceae UAMH 11346]